MRLAEVTEEVKIFAEGRVIAQIGVKLGPIISINEVVVCLMDDVNIPTHEVHLEVKDSLIGSIMQKDKLDCIAISDPHKLTTVTLMAYFIYTHKNLHQGWNEDAACSPGYVGNQPRWGIAHHYLFW
jgi:hypothetical protein